MNADGEQELQTRISPKESECRLDGFRVSLKPRYPIDSGQWIWHAGTLFYFRKWVQMASNYPNSRFDPYGGGGAEGTAMISVRSYSFTRKPLFKLLEEAKRTYERTKPDMVTLRVLDQRGTWRKVAYRHKRPLSSIIMDKDKRAELLRDAKEFLSSESWYTKRGIPWKRGFLLHGSPGTGKSSTSNSGPAMYFRSSLADGLSQFKPWLRKSSSTCILSLSTARVSSFKR